MNGGEVVIKLVLLGWGHFYANGANRLQELVQGVELLAQCAEVIIQCNVAGAAEDVVPLSFCIEIVEEETAEETVFCIFDEGEYLLRGACRKCPVFYRKRDISSHLIDLPVEFFDLFYEFVKWK